MVKNETLLFSTPRYVVTRKDKRSTGLVVRATADGTRVEEMTPERFDQMFFPDFELIKTRKAYSQASCELVNEKAVIDAWDGGGLVNKGKA